MLSEIQKTEQEVREQISAAKQNSAEAIQTARNNAAEAKTKLEDTLRQQEADAVQIAETTANQKAEELIEEANGQVSGDSASKILSVAKDILATYIK